MPKDDPKFAKLFTNGQSQAVRLPKQFRFEGDRVRIRRIGSAVVLEPLIFDVKKYFADIDSCGAGDFMSEGRDQPPPMPEGVDFD